MVWQSFTCLISNDLQLHMYTESPRNLFNRHVCAYLMETPKYSILHRTLLDNLNNAYGAAFDVATYCAQTV